MAPKPAPPGAPRRWCLPACALVLLLLLASPCLAGQLAVVRARCVDTERLRADADRLLARPPDLDDPRWDDPLAKAELEGYPYLARFQEVRRWGADSVIVPMGGGIPALVAVVVVARGADARPYERRPDGFTCFRRLADRVYLYEGYR